MRSHASFGVEIPPTPMSTRESPTRPRSRLSTSNARSATGGPEIPPGPMAATCDLGVTRPSREIVVFVATIPSKPNSNARSATASTSSSDKSGAIFTNTGVFVASCTA